MKFALVVLVALGLTMTWQASVVADNKTELEPVPQITVSPAGMPDSERPQRG